MADQNQYSEDTNQENQGDKGGQATDVENGGGTSGLQDDSNMEDLE